MATAPRALAWTAAVIVALLALVWALIIAIIPAHDPDAAAHAGRERCLDCHATPADDPGGLRPAKTMGCVACHLGNPSAVVAELAHRGMEPEPGALRSVARTCGRCHAREVERVQTSLMATARGLVAVDRWAFGELPTPDGDETISDVLAAADPTPAQRHLRRLCAGCHLNSTKDNRDDAIARGATGSGCSACHTTPRASRFEGHPPVDARIPDSRCLGCHSRSGRIALGYHGLAEVIGSGLTTCADPTTLHDGRAACRQPADVHAEAGLACVDCHLHSELMGDGTPHRHEELATEVRCESCHGPVPDSAEVTWAGVSDPITRDLLRQRQAVRPPDEPVRLGARGTPLWNLRPGADGAWTLLGKLDGRPHPVRPTPRDATHQQPGHERLSCATCHAPWAPRCTTCHTSFDDSLAQWDFAAAQESSGAWIEVNHGMGVGPPTLGVDAAGRIRPAMPGMVAEIDASGAGGPRRALRLYANIAPHTTRKQARSCASCHSDPFTLGLGTGTLDLAAATPRFTPAAPAEDAPGLAADAWVGLLPAAPSPGTRVGARSLDAAEQRRTLTVGACLACHDAAATLWAGFPDALARLAHGDAPACEGRVWGWMQTRP